jgi:hypothetical protein
MAINWTVEYENQPRNVSNPGFIADAVRTLKTAVSERLSPEHFFGAGESTDVSKHREGSARAYVVDDDATRADIVSANTDVGRMSINLETLSPVPTSGDSNVTGDELYTRSLSVWDKDGTKITVFDPEEYVSRSQDLTITGRKVYSVENPEVQEDLDDTTYDGLDVAPKARADNKAVKRSDIKTWTDEAKAHNIFDVEDTDNNVVATSPLINNPISDKNETTSESISANVIFANKVYGAVYG